MSYPQKSWRNNALRALLATSVMTAMSWCERQYTLTGGRDVRNLLILLVPAPVIFGMRRAIDTVMTTRQATAAVSTETMTTTQTTPATPCKLRSGAWGARTSAGIQAGDTITITTRSGKSWDARVDVVIWAGDDAAVVATTSMDRPPARPTTRRGGTGCSCTDDCCRPRCRCDAHCVCRGGNIYDC